MVKAQSNVFATLPGSPERRNGGTTGSNKVVDRLTATGVAMCSHRISGSQNAIRKKRISTAAAFIELDNRPAQFTQSDGFGYELSVSKLAGIRDVSEVNGHATSTFGGEA